MFSEFFYWKDSPSSTIMINDLPYAFRHQWLATSMVSSGGAKLAVSTLLLSWSLSPLLTQHGFPYLAYMLKCASIGRENHWRYCSWYNICFGGLFSSSSTSSIYWIYFYRGISLRIGYAKLGFHCCMCFMYSSKEILMCYTIKWFHHNPHNTGLNVCAWSWWGYLYYLILWSCMRLFYYICFDLQHWFSLILAVTVSGLLEAYTAQLDNAFIPLVFYSLLCL